MAADEPQSPANEPRPLSPSIKHGASANEPKASMSNDSGTPPPDLSDLDEPPMQPKLQRFPVITILGKPQCFFFCDGMRDSAGWNTAKPAMQFSVNPAGTSLS